MYMYLKTLRINRITLYASENWRGALKYLLNISNFSLVSNYLLCPDSSKVWDCKEDI